MGTIVVVGDGRAGDHSSLKPYGSLRPGSLMVETDGGRSNFVLHTFVTKRKHSALAIWPQGTHGMVRQRAFVSKPQNVRYTPGSMCHRAEGPSNTSRNLPITTYGNSRACVNTSLTQHSIWLLTHKTLGASHPMTII